MTEETLRARIGGFLAEHTTMTLATSAADGTPAAAAVFYAADDSLNLVFLSEETTEHSRNLLARPDVAATIQADGQDWRTSAACRCAAARDGLNRRAGPRHGGVRPALRLRRHAPGRR